jgi:cytochrome c
MVTRAPQRRWFAAVLGLLLAACDGGTGTAGSESAPAPGPAVGAAPVRAAGFDAGPIKTPAEYLQDPELASADFARGELLGLACAACHRFGAGEGTLIGPNLHGVFGRAAATVEGFDYSPALEQSGLVWTPRSLSAWLADPAGFVAGTTMPFTGYRSAADRRDLIAYLLRATE